MATGSIVWDRQKREAIPILFADSTAANAYIARVRSKAKDTTTEHKGAVKTYDVLAVTF